MSNKFQTSLKTVLITGLCIIGLSSCGGINATRTAVIPEGSTILILPPRDVTQGGNLHPAGQGTGMQLQKVTQERMAALSTFNVISVAPTVAMNNEREIRIEDAIAVGRQNGAHYCLILNLGEFLDAAPMTFRPDYVTLQSGELIDLMTQKSIWSVKRPYRVDKTNLGSTDPLINLIGKMVAKSILK